jgi:hypothetical protein
MTTSDRERRSALRLTGVNILGEDGLRIRLDDLGG